MAVVDQGTGFVNYGRMMMAHAKNTRRMPTLYSFTTHFHPDHIEGFKGYGPAFLPETLIKFYAEHKEFKDRDGNLATDSLEAIFRRRIGGAGYPVYFDRQDLAPEERDRVPYMPFKREFYFVTPTGKKPHHGAQSKIPIGKDMEVEVIEGNHPDGVAHYVFTNTHDGSKVACVWDHEHQEGVIDERLTDLLKKGVGLFIFDTSFGHRDYGKQEIRELSGKGAKRYHKVWNKLLDLDQVFNILQIPKYEDHIGWGHSTLYDAARLAQDARVCLKTDEPVIESNPFDTDLKRITYSGGLVSGFHIEPRIGNLAVNAIKADVRNLFPKVNVDFAQEGSMMEVRMVNDVPQVIYHKANLFQKLIKLEWELL